MLKLGRCSCFFGALSVVLSPSHPGVKVAKIEFWFAYFPMELELHTSWIFIIQSMMNYSKTFSGGSDPHRNIVWNEIEYCCNIKFDIASGIG